jgi:hypothetical protein
VVAAYSRETSIRNEIQKPLRLAFRAREGTVESGRWDRIKPLPSRVSSEGGGSVGVVGVGGASVVAGVVHCRRLVVATSKVPKDK